MHKIFHAQNRVSEVEYEGYGYLYNPFAMIDSNFAPTDYRVPTYDDCQTLDTFIAQDGGALKETGFTYWNSPNTGATNSTDFSARGAGRRTSAAAFSGLNTAMYHWANTEHPIYTGQYYVLRLQNVNDFYAFANSGDDNFGFTIRLVYTGTGTPTNVTDYDGNVYDVVKIGTQYWVKQNWKCTHLNNGTLIPNITDGTAWTNATSLALCAYNNDENNV